MNRRRDRGRELVKGSCHQVLAPSLEGNRQELHFGLTHKQPSIRSRRAAAPGLALATTNASSANLTSPTYHHDHRLRCVRPLRLDRPAAPLHALQWHDPLGDALGPLFWITQMLHIGLLILNGRIPIGRSVPVTINGTKIDGDFVWTPVPRAD